METFGVTNFERTVFMVCIELAAFVSYPNLVDECLNHKKEKKTTKLY